MMHVLRKFDDQNYDNTLPIIKRIAVRAIFYKDGKMAMVTSQVHQYYKFPGGGVEVGETKEDALIRETQEETGLRIKRQSIKPFGYTIEKRMSLFEKAIFLQYSYYYIVDVEEDIGTPHLVDYEISEGFQLVFVDPLQAIVENDLVFQEKGYTFLQRENYILKRYIETCK